MTMRKFANSLLAMVCAGEAGFGLFLLFFPETVMKLFLDAQAGGVISILCRVFGISVIALGISCRPQVSGNIQKIWAMLIYSSLVTVYLGYVAVMGEWVGVLLWPVVGVHFLLCILLIAIGLRAAS